MKKLFIIILSLILFNSTYAVSDEISDFEIEGMSIGDSLLDYLTEEEIKNKEKYIYENNKFIAIIISKPSFELYEDVQIVYESSNKKIHSLEGMISYRKNIKDCYNKKDEIVSELTEFFENKVKIRSQNNIKYQGDKSGKSKFSAVNFYFDIGGTARVICYDFEEKISMEKNGPDTLTVVINSIEFDKYLSTL